MVKKSPFIILAVLLVLLAVVFSNNKKVNEEKLPTHPLVFFDDATFYQGVNQAKKENKSFTYHVSGGIVPHHLYPGFVIADFFSRLSTQKPKTIILIGPNHLEKGDGNALTSLYGWQTPFGVTEPNIKVIQELLDKDVLKVNEDVVASDQAVASVIPFVKYYLPDAKVVPILLSGFMTEEEIIKFSDMIKKYLDEETTLIAAVDFSHGLVSREAKEKDKITQALIEKFDYKRLLELNNEYLDSSRSIAVLLRTMQSMGAKRSEILYHTNSGELQKNDSFETTSYFSITYY